MTDEETQAAMYLKLQDDAKTMVQNIVLEMFKGYDPALRQQVENMTFGSYLFEQRVKQVIQSQWNKS